MTDGERLEEIVETAVARGTRRGWSRPPRFPDETGMPAVCEDILTAARAAG